MSCLQSHKLHLYEHATIHSLDTLTELKGEVGKRTTAAFYMALLFVRVRGVTGDGAHRGQRRQEFHSEIVATIVASGN